MRRAILGARDNLETGLIWKTGSIANGFGEDVDFVKALIASGSTIVFDPAPLSLYFAGSGRRCVTRYPNRGLLEIRAHRIGQVDDVLRLRLEPREGRDIIQRVYSLLVSPLSPPAAVTPRRPNGKVNRGAVPSRDSAGAHNARAECIGTGPLAGVHIQGPLHRSLELPMDGELAFF